MSKIDFWAEKLHGRQYPKIITQEEIVRAKEDNVTIVYGMSDDLLEFSGLINEEFGAWEGKTVWISPTSDPEVFNRPPLHHLYWPSVRATWCPRGLDGLPICSWVIDTSFRSRAFSIREGDSIYCVGAIFCLDDVLAVRRP